MPISVKPGLSLLGHAWARRLQLTPLGRKQRGRAAGSGRVGRPRALRRCNGLSPLVLSRAAREPSHFAAGGGVLRDWGRQQPPLPSVGDLQTGGCNAASSAAPRSCPPPGSRAVDLRLVAPLSPRSTPSSPQHPSLPAAPQLAVRSCWLLQPQQGRGAAGGAGLAVLVAGGGAQPRCTRVVLLCQEGLMARIDPEAIQLLGWGSSEKPGWLQECSPRALLNCPAHRGESGTPPCQSCPRHTSAPGRLRRLRKQSL